MWVVCWNDAGTLHPCDFKGHALEPAGSATLNTIEFYDYWHSAVHVIDRLKTHWSGLKFTVVRVDYA